MIVATAGHVDHGKTSLIKQLTGVETDRLAEEKRRGLSISLGYAYLPRGEHTPIGFIDVPGHQRFINNMISGISGIDRGMLVVAADDGPMPQTREHLDVLHVLGVQNLTVVLSKTDRVEPQRVEEVAAQTSSLLAEHHWVQAPVFCVSNTSGEGIEALKRHLLECAEQQSPLSDEGSFRISIDRSFSVQGAGLVVTGTVSSGRVDVGDILRLAPAGLEARVRGLRVHDREAQQASAGQRCAINLAGNIDKSDIERGDWLLQLDAGEAAARIDVAFSLLGSAPFELKHLAPVKLHIGAKRVAGRIAILHKEGEANKLRPGDDCLAQLLLHAPVACYRGQRFLLRDHAEDVILGGGEILEPDGIHVRKNRDQRLKYLAAMGQASPVDALAKLVQEGFLVELERFRQAWNLRASQLQRIIPPEAHAFSAEERDWMVNTSRWETACANIVASVAQWHREQPKVAGIKANALTSSLAAGIESPLLIAALTAELRRGNLKLSDGLIHLPGFKPAVSKEFSAGWAQMEQLLQKAGNQIPLLSELAKTTGKEVAQLDRLGAAAVRDGFAFKVSKRRYALPAQLKVLCDALIDLSSEGQPVTVIAMKQRWDTGRNLTVEILEYFDSIRFTQRRNEERVILDAELPARLFDG